MINIDNKDTSCSAQGQNSCCFSGSSQDISLKLSIGGARSDTNDLKVKSDCILGSIRTPAGIVPHVSTKWSFSDRWGEIRSRMGAYRMRYSVPPGLYAVGEPDQNANVFVSANYKLSFDKLRTSLRGINGWILVLDTKGINVWCAAGKGTFGTEELIRRMTITRLDKVVEHRRLIIPQLGAVGVSATAVKKRTKFTVYFGPVNAKDIPDYINKGFRATKEMRTIKFNIVDRIILTPMEINPAMKKYPLYVGIVLLIFGIQPAGILFKDSLVGGMPFLLLGLIAVLAGAFLTPAFLPFIPFRSFAVKGWIVGVGSIFLAVNYLEFIKLDNTYLLIMTYLFFPCMASYIALQFTGSTTYTGMSGVKKELKRAIPIYITVTVLAFIFTLVYKLDQWGLV